MAGRREAPERDAPGAVAGGQQVAAAADRDRIDEGGARTGGDSRQRGQLRVPQREDLHLPGRLVGDRQAVTVSAECEPGLSRCSEQPRRYLTGRGVDQSRARVRRRPEPVGDECQLRGQRRVARLEVAGLERHVPREHVVAGICGAVALARRDGGKRGHAHGEQRQPADEQLRVCTPSDDHGAAILGASARGASLAIGGSRGAHISAGGFQSRHAGVVHARLRRADRRPGTGLAGDRLRRACADLRAHRIRQDACGLPVGDRPA